MFQLIVERIAEDPMEWRGRRRGGDGAVGLPIVNDEGGNFFCRDTWVSFLSLTRFCNLLEELLFIGAYPPLCFWRSGICVNYKWSWNQGSCSEVSVRNSVSQRRLRKWVTEWAKLGGRVMWLKGVSWVGFNSGGNSARQLGVLGNLAMFNVTVLATCRYANG